MKKRIYSKDKTPRYKTTKPIENSFSLLCEIKNLEDNVWKNYINDVVWNENKCDDLKNIIMEIPNKHLQKSIIMYLMTIENFNPYDPKFSLIEKKDFYNLLRKKEKYYQEYKNYHKKVIINNQLGIIVHTSFYDKNISVPYKLIFNSHSKKLMFKNGGTKLFNVKNIYNELIKLEPNKWEHNNSYTAIFTKNEINSNIDIKTIVNILRENINTN